MIIIPIKWLFVWEYTLFSDKPICEITILTSLFFLKKELESSILWRENRMKSPLFKSHVGADTHFYGPSLPLVI